MLKRETFKYIYSNIATNESITLGFQQNASEYKGIKLFELTGKQVSVQKISGNKETIYVKDSPKSLYILEVFNNKKSERIKLINNAFWYKSKIAAI